MRQLMTASVLALTGVLSRVWAGMSEGLQLATDDGRGQRADPRVRQLRQIARLTKYRFPL